MAYPTFEITLGRLLCRGFRDYLKGMKLAYPSLDWHEGGGLFEHTFWIAGTKEAIERIGNDVRAWEKAREGM